MVRRMDRFLPAYGALLTLRLTFALAPGYIHPDEFFQSVEPAAALIFNAPVWLPWEFSDPAIVAPIRSWVAPLLNCGPAMLLVRCLAGTNAPPAGWSLLMAVRVLMCVGSLAQDATVAMLCARHGWPVRRTLLVLASAWPTLVFASRPFSNSLEVLAVCAALLLALPEPVHHTTCSSPPPLRTDEGAPANAHSARLRLRPQSPPRRGRRRRGARLHRGVRRRLGGAR
jgi:phosphatidylinositol glycan class Z